VALLWGVVGVRFAPLAAATAVSDEATFRAAWADASETTIELGADIMLTCGGGGLAVRNSATAITIHGAGHRITQTCAGNGILAQDGTGAVTVDSTALSGGDTPVAGGALRAAGEVTITASTISGNRAGGHGGGVWSPAGVSASGSVFSDNHAGLTAPNGYGGAIETDGFVSITDSMVTDNTADGSGGITGDQGVHIVRSTISNNNGPVGAGGAGSLGTIVVEDSTISGNSAINSGAGGVGAVGAITIINSTIVDNDAGSIGGGGIFSDTSVTLVYATVVHNGATGGAANLVTPTLRSFASVVALAQNGAANCHTGTTSSSYSFSDDGSCLYAASTDRQDAGDPELGPLAANGGPTLTRAPIPTSPLVDVIEPEACHDDGASGITTDQRGVTRPQGAGCDIGAVEIAGAPRPVVQPPSFTG